VTTALNSTGVTLFRIFSLIGRLIVQVTFETLTKGTMRDAVDVLLVFMVTASFAAGLVGFGMLRQINRQLPAVDRYRALDIRLNLLKEHQRRYPNSKLRFLYRIIRGLALFSAVALAVVIFIQLRY
jgi:hypothetical protein